MMESGAAVVTLSFGPVTYTRGALLLCSHGQTVCKFYKVTHLKSNYQIIAFFHPDLSSILLPFLSTSVGVTLPSGDPDFELGVQWVGFCGMYLYSLKPPPHVTTSALDITAIASKEKPATCCADPPSRMSRRWGWCRSKVWNAWSRGPLFWLLCPSSHAAYIIANAHAFVYCFFL